MSYTPRSGLSSKELDVTVTKELLKQVHATKDHQYIWEIFRDHIHEISHCIIQIRTQIHSPDNSIRTPRAFSGLGMCLQLLQGAW